MSSEKLSSVRITGKTKIVGIIGYPVSHSLSPPMHNSAFEALGLDYVYVAFTVKPEHLEKAFEGLVFAGVKGFNVTIPHKVEIMNLLDELDDTARATGAVNTVVVAENLKTKGYNTDVEGFLQGLREKNISVNGRRALMFGAGGAGRAVAYGLLREGLESLIIANRTLEKAESLRRRLLNLFPGRKIETIPLHKAHEKISEADLIVNTTSLGMKGQEVLEVDLSRAPSHAAVCEIVYTPLKTPLISQAEKLQLKTVTGELMLLYQGAKAFELWTGKKAPVDVMRKALLNSISF